METQTRTDEARTGATDWPQVHQAAGMLVVQLDVSIDVANERLRAYAAGTDRPVNDVARDIVARRLQLSPPAVEPI